MFFGKDKDKDEPPMKNYKFKGLKTYSSDEWMANSTKKYRTVFDRAETTYIRVEFSFYNKLFDEQEWTCKVYLKCYELTGTEKKELCNLDTERKITVDENIVFIRDGWGNAKEGAYWKKGKYIWEAWIDEEKVGETAFIINDVGIVTASDNPYFDVEYIKLYIGGYNDWEKKERTYLKKINRDTTQYVWVEARLKNKISEDWSYELFFNFMDDAKQLKGQVIRTGDIPEGKKDYSYTFDVGWGNDKPGSWKDDRYSLELLFMDTLVARIEFESGIEEVEGDPELILSTDKLIKIDSDTKTEKAQLNLKEESLDELLEKLDKLIGLTEVKKNIKDHINYLNFLKIRKEKGFEESGKLQLHSVFTGNPGTGKTTVVNMLGNIYKKMGLLSKGHVVEADRADLVGEYIGQTAPKVKKLIDKVRGGILFIDEAYSLARQGDDAKDFGKEVIEILLKEMSDGEGDIAIMAAGYPREMETFLTSNPGLKSRFGHYYHFEDYLPDELLQIAIAASDKRSVKLTDDAKKYLELQLIELYRTRDRSFGNARLANSIIDEAKMNMGLRLVKTGNLSELTEEQLSTIEREDLEKIFGSKAKTKPDLGINEKLLRDALEELNSLVGMANIKAEIQELIKLVRFYRETGKDVLNRFSLHAVFTGNPGTGKTTVARIIADIYKALGLLEKGHLVETDRQGLVAGYVGQTAVKTQEKVDEAIGGVLFVDEAYALGEGGAGDFGKEAVEVILKQMEDKRGRFAVIVAGYPDNMYKFLETNPGLKSRFDRHYVFHDYSSEELFFIAQMLLKKENLTPTPDAETHIRNYLQALYDSRDKFFGNARTVRQMVGEAVKNQHLRMAALTAEERTQEMMNTLTMEDVAEFEIKAAAPSRKQLGFRLNKD
ncbi:MAG: hypothetical protein Fur0041_08840 [Bacteroidia bacterium]